MVSLYREVVTEVQSRGRRGRGRRRIAGRRGQLPQSRSMRRAAGMRTVHVIRAWRIADAMTPDASSAGYVPSLTELEANTLQDLRGRVHRVLGEPEDVEVHLHAVYASAARALITASESAEVVVVGSRGLRGFASLLLGSVADQCTRHCASPVIVVRQPQPASAQQGEAST